MAQGTPAFRAERLRSDAALTVLLAR
jgi:hypothetical protein